jgi:hypothetical protein
MARPIRNIDIYFPLDFNDGRPIPETKYTSLQQELLNRFGGVTSTQRQFPLQGLWRSEAETFQDRVVIFSVMDFREENQFKNLQYLERLKKRLKRKFDQLEILITVQELLAI